MEWLILGAFSFLLLLCIILDVSILFALAFGLLLFCLYGRRKGFSWPELGRMAWKGIKTVRNVLMTLLLVGVLTAFWRAAGTVPVIVCYASRLIQPAVFLLMTFLLNSGVSVLTGTSFGTAATMGVICTTMGMAMNIPPILIGGAVLSGVFFGDRCSPVSTSALLVASVTGTDIYRNIRGMVRTALVPFLLTCLVYFALGLFLPRTGTVYDLESLFSRSFRLHWLALLPAAVILGLAAFRVNVKIAMTVSILSAVPLCLFLQNMEAGELMKVVIFGFTPENPEVAAMVSGGGVLSMLKVTGIVCLSSSYSDIFQKTGLLDGAKRAVSVLAEKTTVFISVLATSVLAGMIACNQTLTILLTHQLCGEVSPDRERFAIDLEDTAVLTAPLIPWSIAGAVPLSAIGAQLTALAASFYLMFIPLWRAVTSWAEKKRGK